MKKYLLIILVSSSTFIFVSCSGNQRENITSEQKNPEALQDDLKMRGLYSNRENLVEELYTELVEKNPELKKLETDLQTFQNEPAETKNVFQNYNAKSTNFYEDAKDITNRITDSLNKKRILALIKKSNDQYYSKSSEINELVKQISVSQNTVEDNHTLLKIVLTIPLIEKYQKENLPQKKPFFETLNKLKELDKEIKQKTPKY